MPSDPITHKVIKSEREDHDVDWSRFPQLSTS